LLFLFDDNMIQMTKGRQLSRLGQDIKPYWLFHVIVVVVAVVVVVVVVFVRWQHDTNDKRKAII